MNTHTDNKAAAELALHEMFKALAPLCGQFDITAKRAAELLSAAFVDELDKAGINQVQIIAQTGYSAKTVQKYRQKGPGTDKTDLITRIIGSWASDPELPDELPLSIEQYPSIHDLCQRYGRDLTATSLCKELSRRNLVELTDTHISRKTQLVIAQDKVDAIPIASRSLCDLIRTLTHNLSNHSDLLPQQRFYSHRMKEVDLPAVRDELRTNIRHFQKSVSQILRKYECEEEEGEQIIGTGIYVFQKPRD